MQTSSPFFETTTTGVLKVTVENAKLVLNKKIFGTPKLFCKVRLGFGLQETIVDSHNFLNPVWMQELSFQRKNENSIKIEVCDTGLLKPVVLAECSIQLNAVFYQRQLKITVQLTSNFEPAGTIHVSFRWIPANSPESHLPFQNHNISQPNYQGNPFSTPQQSVPLHQPSYNTNVPPVTVIYTSYPSSNFSQCTYPSTPTVSFQQIPNNMYTQVSPSVQHLPQYIPQMGYSQPKPVVQEEIKEEPIDPNLKDEEKCVVCLERKKAGAFYRCGHNCCCKTCGLKFIGAPCPICRQVVLDFIKVYS